MTRCSSRVLVGGDRIGLAVLPLIVVGVVLNVLFPEVLAVGGPPQWLQVLSLVVLAVGLVGWAWTVVLILWHVPRGGLITTGPTWSSSTRSTTASRLLVLPWAGCLLDTWLGVVLGGALPVASRRFAPAEEAWLAGHFGAQWDRYRASVALPWL